MPLLTLLGQVSASKTIGGTTQLSALTSTGGLNVFTVHTIGGSSQIGALGSTGGLNVKTPIDVGGTSQLGVITSTGGLSVLTIRTIGGTDQLAALSSTGGIQAGDARKPTGGFWPDYDKYNYKRRVERERLKRLEEKAKKIEAKLDREIALEERKHDSEEIRLEELKALTKIATEHREDIKQSFNERAIIAADRAIAQGNFSAMAALDREIERIKEEEWFLLEATRIILNQ